MKTFRTFAVLALLGLVATSPVLAMDADELIAKNLEASGGLERLQAIQTSLAKGKAMAQGMEFPFEMKMSRPNLMRLDVEVMGMQMVQAYDGEKGWTINPMTGSQDAQPMGELENMSFSLQADMDGLLANYKDKGYTVEYVGEADVEGTPCHQLSVKVNESITMNMFFDKDYFLVIKQSTKIDWDGQIVEQDTYLSDFQEMNGLVMPFAIETRMGETTVNQIVLETVEHGVEIDESIFVMPAAAPAAPATPEKGE